MAAPRAYIQSASRVSGFASEVIVSHSMPKELLGLRCAIVSEMTRGGYSAEQIARNMGRTANSIYWWRNLIREGNAPPAYLTLATNIRAAVEEHDSRRKVVRDACESAVLQIRTLESKLMGDLALLEMGCCP